MKQRAQYLCKVTKVYSKIYLGEDDDEVGGAIVAYTDRAISEQVYDIGQMFKFWAYKTL